MNHPTDLDPTEARAERIAVRLRAAGFGVLPDLRVKSDAAAALLGVAEGTLANWRAEGNRRFRHVKPAGVVTYYLVDLLAYIDSTTD